MVAYLLLVQKMTIKSMLNNSPKSIKVFCNINGSVGLRGVSSCWPEQTSEETFFSYQPANPCLPNSFILKSWLSPWGERVSGITGEEERAD